MGYVSIMNFYNPMLKSERLLIRYYTKVGHKESLAQKASYDYDSAGWLIKKTIVDQDSSKIITNYKYNEARDIIQAITLNRRNISDTLLYQFSSGKQPYLEKIVSAKSSGRDTTIFQYNSVNHYLERVFTKEKEIDVDYGTLQNLDSDDIDDIKYEMPALVKSDRFKSISFNDGKLIRINLEKDGDGGIVVFVSKDVMAYSLRKRNAQGEYYKTNGLYIFSKPNKLNYLFYWTDIYVGWYSLNYEFENRKPRDPIERIVGDVYEDIRTKKGWKTKMTFARQFYKGRIVQKKGRLIENNGAYKRIIEKY